METQVNPPRAHVHSTPGVGPRQLAIGIPTSQSLPPTQYHPPLARASETGQTSTEGLLSITHLILGQNRCPRIPTSTPRPSGLPCPTCFRLSDPCSPLQIPPRLNRSCSLSRSPLRICNRSRYLLDSPAPADATPTITFIPGTSVFFPRPHWGQGHLETGGNISGTW